MEKKKLIVNHAGTRILNGFKKGFLALGAILFVVGFILFLTDISWMEKVGTWSGLMCSGVAIALSGLSLGIIAPIVRAAEVFLAEKNDEYELTEEEKPKDTSDSNTPYKGAPAH